MGHVSYERRTGKVNGGMVGLDRDFRDNVMRPLIKIFEQRRYPSA